jgi:hypothetical protein
MWQAAITSRALLSSIPWSTLKPMEWYEYRSSQWEGPHQKPPIDHYFTRPDPDSYREFRRCEPPKWWREYVLEKEGE